MGDWNGDRFEGPASRRAGGRQPGDGSLRIPAHGGVILLNHDLTGTVYYPAPYGLTWPGFHVIGIAHGQWYRLVTSPFLHLLPNRGPLGLVQIAGNMWSLWVFGPALERVTGRLWFAALYLLSALGCSVAAYLVPPGTAEIGASGAIFGLVGAHFVISRGLGRDISYANWPIFSALVFLVVSAWSMSWEGDLGGLLAGSALTAAYAYPPGRRRTVVRVAATVGVLVALFTITAVKTVLIDRSGVVNLANV